MKHRELYKAKGLPVFQNKMFEDLASAVACPVGDLTLVQDMNSGLIYNSTFDASLLKYDSSYQNEQAHSVMFQQHLNDVKTIIGKHFMGTNLVEIGCGKGYFLNLLEQSGFKITGVDPAYEGQNPNIIKSFFDSTIGLQADGIVLRHVLEHLPDPFSFLLSICKTNINQGRIYIEVPCFDWILKHNAWFDLFYEHVNYFRLADFHRMFGIIHESGHVFGGQYLYVVADLASLRRPLLEPNGIISFPSNFLTGISSIAKNISRKRNAIWGAASKGLIFALHMHQAGVKIDLVIDINTAKQNKYMAGIGLYVFSPQEGLDQLQNGDNIIILNSNYLNEIKELSQNRYNYLQVDEYGL